MRLCMFHPLDHPMERGWVGRIEGDRVTQLAAQTLQSLFTGGGSAREHAEYPLAGVRLLAPVLHPPSVRVFDGQMDFAFANPAAIVGPKTTVPISRDVPSDSSSRRGLTLLARVAGIIGADGALAGVTAFSDWRDRTRSAPKDRDFVLGLGPVVATLEDVDIGKLEAIVRVDGVERVRGGLVEFDWVAARDLAAEGTRLYPGDLLVSPQLRAVDEIGPGAVVELEVLPIGVLEQVVGA